MSGRVQPLALPRGMSMVACRWLSLTLLLRSAGDAGSAMTEADTSRLQTVSAHWLEVSPKWPRLGSP